jgi:hypothetical protein
MRIAIHSQGDWNDADVEPEIVRLLVERGAIRPSGSDTGAEFGEDEVLPIFLADEWPGWDRGFAYIS